jgi:HEPN domain-containing protein
LQGLFLEFPPSFRSLEDLDVSEGWVEDEQTFAFFMGLLQGALGWDSFNQIPSTIKTSLEEAEKALSITNYRSCVVMCRRTIEALLKFAFPRLLGKTPMDNQGRELTLDAMIREFKQQQPPPIPLHLLHILDSVRVIGNIPGAHAGEIEDYKFSKPDAEFTLASAQYFIDRYFSEIDKEVSKYYTLRIDLDEQP